MDPTAGPSSSPMTLRSDPPQRVTTYGKKRKRRVIQDAEDEDAGTRTDGTGGDAGRSDVFGDPDEVSTFNPRSPTETNATPERPGHLRLRSQDNIHLARVVYSPSSTLRGGGKSGGSGRPRKARGAAPRSRPADNNGRKRVTRAQARRLGSASPTADLEEIKEEDTAVKAEVGRLNLSLRDMKGDGNCLFRGLGDQLFGSQSYHPEIRKLVCDYLEEHEEEMQDFAVAFLAEGEKWDGYVSRMRQLGQFGGSIELHAAARVFRRSIRVVMSTTSYTIPYQSQSPTSENPPSTPPGDTLPLRRRTRSSTANLMSTPAAPPPSSPSYARTLAEYIPPIRSGRTMLWLALFSKAEHYQSVRRKGDTDTGAAEIEDRLAVPHAKDMSEAARRERGELEADGTIALPADPGKNQEAAPKSGSDGFKRPLHPKTASVLSSLPSTHQITESHASSVLERVKGDLGEAVEILLEEIQTEDEGEGDAGTGTGVQNNVILEGGTIYREPASPSSSSRPPSERSAKSASPPPTPSPRSPRHVLPTRAEAQKVTSSGIEHNTDGPLETEIKELKVSQHNSSAPNGVIKRGRGRPKGSVKSGRRDEIRPVAVSA